MSFDVIVIDDDDFDTANNNPSKKPKVTSDYRSEEAAERTGDCVAGVKVSPPWGQKNIKGLGDGPASQVNIVAVTGEAWSVFRDRVGADRLCTEDPTDSHSTTDVQGGLAMNQNIPVAPFPPARGDASLSAFPVPVSSICAAPDCVPHAASENLQNGNSEFIPSSLAVEVAPDLRKESVKPTSSAWDSALNGELTLPFKAAEDDVASVSQAFRGQSQPGDLEMRRAGASSSHDVTPCGTPLDRGRREDEPATPPNRTVRDFTGSTHPDFKNESDIESDSEDAETAGYEESEQKTSEQVEMDVGQSVESEGQKSEETPVEISSKHDAAKVSGDDAVENCDESVQTLSG